MAATVIQGKPLLGNTHLTTRVEVRGPRRTNTVKVLIDGGANVNIISQILVKDLGLEPTQIESWTVSGLAGHPIIAFGTHEDKMTIRDSKDLA